ncbi:MAG: hypothetical protein LBD48_06750 [Treponema sp.]|nr:hypothetical protein [Treponema sp.]
MKKTILTVLLAAAAFALASCDILDIFSDTDLKPPDNSLNNNLPEGQFYAQNLGTQQFYIVNAAKLTEGSKCEIWAEKNSGVSQSTAASIANEYDTNIYQKIVDAFSIRNFDFSYTESGIGKTEHFSDMMEFADWLTDENGKLTILLLDIKDGYKKPTDAYTAGYFFGGNLYDKGPVQDEYGSILFYSNGKDMMYVDTYPGRPGSQDSNATFAHELQHLINFATTLALQRNSLMDTWIDEGLSSQAEFLYLNNNPPDRLEWFNKDSNNTISKGNNFFVWGNYTGNSILDEYATVYLFFHWLYLQNNKNSSLFLNITRGNYTDYRAVTSVATGINSGWNSWDTLLRTWMAANYAPTNTSYGYKGDTELQGIQIKTTSGAGNKIALYPGEGVYSQITSLYKTLPASGSGGSIRYATLTGSGQPVPVTSGTLTGNALLTYNISTSTTGSTEIGHLTGASGTASMTSSSGRSLTGSSPAALDARDILGRNNAKPPHFPVPLQRR